MPDQGFRLDAYAYSGITSALTRAVAAVPRQRLFAIATPLHWSSSTACGDPDHGWLPVFSIALSLNANPSTARPLTAPGRTCGTYFVR